jgi:hydroxymethylpyrimidine pyrophosphatase-like HAD family hydrolase
MTGARTAEQEFYSHYSWCLNPALSVADLFERFQEELERYPTLSGWQREESKANLYLFVCAIACSADDYLALRWIDLKPVCTRVPGLRPLLSSVQPVIDIVESAAKSGDLHALQWRRLWNEVVETVCRTIISNSSEAEEVNGLRVVVASLASKRLPDGLLKRRMRLPEAFRAQDMAHSDVLMLIGRYCESNPQKHEPTVVIGLRTAGAYFAPLMVEYLKSQGFADVSWFSIRPKNGAGRLEGRLLKAAARGNKHVLVVDDYPSTGHTFRITFELLSSFGIRPEQIAVLAPTHAAQPNWARLAKIEPPVRVFTIYPNELYKMAVLQRAAVEQLCTEYFGADKGRAFVVDDSAIETLNHRLSEHSKDGHHVRDKRVFAVGFGDDPQPVAAKKLLFKSVGWGWLGYHAYFAGTRLEGFVPEVIGLRNGLLLSEWLDQSASTPASTTETMVSRIASYVAARSRRLALPGDCRFERRTYRWTGCDEILNILRSAYGPYVNRLKMPVLRKQLQNVVSALPTLVDGRMNPDEWIHTGEGAYKIDFEHHNFGGGEFDIVDPAFDLAAAMFEFGFSKPEQKELLRHYMQESGDSTVEQRLLLHKLLWGTVAMQRATNAVLAGKDPQANNERRTRARNFLVYSMSEFCAQLVRQPAPRTWSPLLFFLDIDGVFDQDLLGFPHATWRALQAITLLRAYDFSMVLHTGRGVHDVRNYCEAYEFPGGIAEFGSVFFDAIHDREIPLTGGLGAKELEACRAAIQALPGVYLDSNYRYAVRAYRYKDGTTAGLATDEIRDFVKRSGFSKLAFIARDADTYIVQKRTGKGAALRIVRRLIGNPGVPVTAIGDSKQDIGMLAAADFGYATANCSPLVRRLSRHGNCRVLRQGFQSGLLAAVEHRLKQERARVPRELPETGGLIETLLQVADRGFVPQAISALMWWSM